MLPSSHFTAVRVFLKQLDFCSLTTFLLINFCWVKIFSSFTIVSKCHFTILWNLLHKKNKKSKTSPHTPKLIKDNKHCTLITFCPYMPFVTVMCDHRKLTRGLTLSLHFHAPHWKLSLWFNSSHCLHGALLMIDEKEAVFTWRLQLHASESCGPLPIFPNLVHRNQHEFCHLS